MVDTKEEEGQTAIEDQAAGIRLSELVEGLGKVTSWRRSQGPYTTVLDEGEINEQCHVTGYMTDVKKPPSSWKSRPGRL